MSTVVNRCHYCELEHQNVEADGIWYCPNILCMGPGAAHWRHTLASYKESAGVHTVDPQEVLDRARAWLYDENDQVIADAVRKSIPRWQKMLEKKEES